MTTAFIIEQKEETTIVTGSNPDGSPIVSTTVKVFYISGRGALRTYPMFMHNSAQVLRALHKASCRTSIARTTLSIIQVDNLEIGIGNGNVATRFTVKEFKERYEGATYGKDAKGSIFRYLLNGNAAGKPILNAGAERARLTMRLRRTPALLDSHFRHEKIVEIIFDDNGYTPRETKIMSVRDFYLRSKSCRRNVKNFVVTSSLTNATVTTRSEFGV